MSISDGAKEAAALEAVRLGFEVFPCCWPTPDGKCGCGRGHEGRDIGKVPLTAHGLKDATQLQIGVNEFWSHWPDANIGVVMDNHLTLDFDKKNGGLESKITLETQHGQFTRTRTHRTGGGGLHMIYSLPPSIKIKNTASILCKGIDTKTSGGYIMWVGSTHVSGGTYTVIDDAPIAEAPAWVIKALLSANKTTPAASGNGHRNDPIPGERIPQGQNDQWLISQAGVYRRRGDSEEIIFDKLKIDARRLDQDPAKPYTDTDFRRIAHSASKYEPGPAESITYTFSDRGNGARFGDMFRGRVLYCPERKMWAVYNGKFWQWDTGAIQVMHFAKEVPKVVYQEAATEPDDNRRKALVDHARRTENDQRLKALLSQAQSEPGLAVSIDQLDRNEWLINAGNGTVDLRTAELRPHRADDLITAYTPVEYHPEAKSTLWDYTVNSIFEGRKAVRDYVQRGLGYSLTGNQDEQVVFFSHGGGNEGKSTFLGAAGDTLGLDYATEIEPQVFMVSKTQGNAGPNEGIAKLYRKRLALSTEVEDGQRLSVSLIKRMTGGEKLHHEKKFEHGFEFTPTHKLWLSGNHKPVITDTTLSIWRRVKFIAFTVVIPAEKRIKDLRTQLKAKEHQEAILAWLVKGCLDWQKNGLREPSEVITATEGYREEMDLLVDFIAEHCVIQASASITVSDLYKAYKTWADQNDTPALGKIKFGTRLTEKGISKGRGNYNKPIWRGIRLLADGEQPQKVTKHAKNDTFVNENSYKAHISQFSLENRGKSVTEVTKVTELTDAADKLFLAYTGLMRQELIDRWTTTGKPKIPLAQGQAISDLPRFLEHELDDTAWAALSKWVEGSEQ
jgi:putative DNA primase/helicase